VASSSGTAAVHVALAMLDLEPGDEVIVPPITDIGSILPILSQNAIPVFADIHPETWTLDPTKVAAELTPRTKAIIAVHLFGNPCDISALRELADRNGVALIEDCAQAHGASYQGRPIGTWGDAGAFSLQWTKHITCGEGGVTITGDPERRKRGKLFVDKGWNRGGGTEGRQYPIFGLNYRLSEMQAAMARSQLARLDTLIARRRTNAGIVQDALEGLPGLRFQRILDGADHSYWQLAFTVGPEAPFTVDALAHCLGRERIECSAHYIGRPIHACHEPLRNRTIYGASDFPFSLSDREEPIDYETLRQPVAEEVLGKLGLLGNVDERQPERLVRQLAERVRHTVESLCKTSMMQVKPRATLALGVVGCGKIAMEHLEAARRIPEIEVCAVADPNPAALATVASSFGVDARYSDYAEMLETEDLDILLVATWPQLHAPIANEAARRKVRAVLCEKPMSSDLQGARSMLEVAGQEGTLLVIGHQHRFNPHLEVARELVEQGEIGAVERAEAHCAGSLINNGSHVIDGLLYVLGEPAATSISGRIERRTGRVNRDQPVEESSEGTIVFENGVEARVEMGDDVAQIGWHLIGERGRMDVDLEGVRVSGQNPRTIQRLRVESMQDQLAGVVDALAGSGAGHRGEAARGFQAMEILIGILESARQGAPIPVPVTQMEYPLGVEESAAAASSAGGR